MEDSTKKIHPGSGRRNALTFNKGRQSDDQSINELKNLISRTDQPSINRNL